MGAQEMAAAVRPSFLRNCTEVSVFSCYPAAAVRPGPHRLSPEALEEEEQQGPSYTSGQVHGPGRQVPGEVRRREHAVSLNRGVTDRSGAKHLGRPGLWLRGSRPVLPLAADWAGAVGLEGLCSSVCS